MVFSIDDKFQSQVRIEQEIKSMLSYLPSLEIVYYIVFAKEVNKLMGKHKGQILLNELEILQDKWIKRGLNSALLNQIKTYYVPAYRPVVCEIARFDVGRFDKDCFG